MDPNTAGQITKFVMSGQAILDLRIMVLNMKCHITTFAMVWQRIALLPATLPDNSSARLLNGLDIKSNKIKQNTDDRERHGAH